MVASTRRRKLVQEAGEIRRREGRGELWRRRGDRFSSAALVTRGWLAPKFGESQIVSEDEGCRQNSR